MHQKGFAPVIVIVIVMVALAALGGAGYVVVKRKTVSPQAPKSVVSPPLELSPSAGVSPSPVSAATPSPPAVALQDNYGLVYLKYEFEKRPWPESQRQTSVQLVFYDPRTNSKKVLHDFSNVQRMGIQPIKEGAHAMVSVAQKARAFLVSIFDSTGVTDHGQAHEIIRQIALDGSVRELLRFPVLNGVDFLSSPSKTRVAYCNVEEPGGLGLIVHDIVANTRKNFGAAPCRLGALLLAFSRDEAKLYYSLGFYEPYGYTDADLRQEAKARGYGVRSIDVAAGTDTLLIPWSRDGFLPLFWNSSNMHYESKIFLEEDRMRGVIGIKKLENGAFDYLTHEEIDRLPVVQQFAIPTRYFQDTLLSVAGDGIFYRVSPPNEPNYTGREFGFYDLASGENYFPLVLAFAEPTPQPSPYLPLYHQHNIFAALSGKALIYSVGVQGTHQDPTVGASVTQTEARLYQLNVNGEEKLIDVAKFGYFTLVALPALSE